MRSPTLFRRELTFLLLATLSVTLYALVAGGGFPLDDAWIHQTYGRNLGLERQFAFLLGEPSAASTAPLYTVLLAAGYTARIPYALWAHALGVLALAFAASAAGLFALRFAPKLRWASWFAGLSVVLAWHMIWAAASGMETAIFAMWSLVLPLMAWHESVAERGTAQTMQRGVTFGVVAALATLTRPEGLGIAGLCGLSLMVMMPGGVRTFALWVGGAAAGFAFVILPALAYNFVVTGGPLPTTSDAKQSEFAPLLALPYLQRVRLMLTPLLAGGQSVLLPGFVAFAVMAVRRSLADRGNAPTLVIVLWPIALILLYAARLPANYQHGRYVIPALPAVLMGGAIGTSYLLGWGRRTLATRVLSTTLAGVALATLAAFAYVIGPGVYATDVAIINEEMVASALWIEEEIPPEDLLAVHDIGAIGFFAPRPIFDLAGLVSPEVIPVLNQPDELWAMMNDVGAVYLMAFPDQIPGGSVEDDRLCEVFITGGETARSVGGPNMAVYRLAWDADCS